MADETELEMAERKVREAGSQVARQREIIAEYRRGGVTVRRAERLLAAFEATLAENQKHLAHLQGAE
jgi:hypothetical protein